MRKRNQQVHRSRGFSLAEVLIASAILSFVTLGIVQAVSAGQSRTLDALKRTRAQALAEVLLEEILAKPYADPEGETSFGPDTASLFKNPPSSSLAVLSKLTPFIPYNARSINS